MTVCELVDGSDGVAARDPCDHVVSIAIGQV